MIIDRAKVRAGKNRNGGGRGSEGEGQEDERGGGISRRQGRLSRAAADQDADRTPADGHT